MYTMRKPIKRLQHLQEVCQINKRDNSLGKDVHSMIGYLRNWMKKQKKDNRGAAMILVIVSIAFIGMLVAMFGLGPVISIFNKCISEKLVGER